VSLPTIVSTMMATPLSLNHFLERAGKLFPNSEIISRLPNKRLKKHSFKQYYDRTLQLASALKSLGLRKGDRVATLSWNHHVHLEAYFGIPAAGGVMHTLNLRLAPEEIAWIASNAQDRFLIVDDILLPLLSKILPHLKNEHQFEKIIVFRFSESELTSESVNAGYLDYDQLLVSAPAFEGYAVHDENDPVAMCYTSGTTGRPKGVVYSHRSTVLHSLVGCTPDAWKLSGSDTVLPVTPMFHANSWGLPYACIMLGTKLVMPGPHLHAHDLLDLMALEPPTMAVGVPTIWLTLIQALEAEPSRWTLPVGMRSLVGGSATPESLIRAFAKRGVELSQGWGMTETSPLATVFYKKHELSQLDEEAWFKRKTLAGLPVPLIDIRIVGETGEIAPWDGIAVGEVQVRGPFVTGDYFNVLREDEKFTADGWLRTGDVAAIDSFGYLRIADRTKDLIKSGGEWISSVDLENAIMGHTEVAEAAVIALPHDKWGERPLACIVLKSPSKAIGNRLPPELLASMTVLLKGHFLSWQLPEAYVVVDAIPRTSTGKFWKAKLREMFPDWPLTDSNDRN
jgi:fatty-acyl-CoA synthase